MEFLNECKHLSKRETCVQFNRDLTADSLYIIHDLHQRVKIRGGLEP